MSDVQTVDGESERAEEETRARQQGARHTAGFASIKFDNHAC